MVNLENMDETSLFKIIKDENSSEMLVDEAKEIIFKRYSYLAKFILKKLRLIYAPCEEEDLICHGYLLINTAINNYDYTVGCPFKNYSYRVIEKGILNQFFQKDKFRNKELVMSNMCDDHDFSTVDSLSKKTTSLSVYEDLILKEQVAGIKDHLTESEYNCVMARYFGASYKETAKTFGYTVKQVDNKIQSVRKDKTKFLKHCSM